MFHPRTLWECVGRKELQALTHCSYKEQRNKELTDLQKNNVQWVYRRMEATFLTYLMMCLSPRVECERISSHKIVLITPSKSSFMDGQAHLRLQRLISFSILNKMKYIFHVSVSLQVSLEQDLQFPGMLIGRHLGPCACISVYPSNFPYICLYFPNGLTSEIQRSA